MVRVRAALLKIVNVRMQCGAVVLHRALWGRVRAALLKINPVERACTPIVAHIFIASGVPVNPRHRGKCVVGVSEISHYALCVLVEHYEDVYVRLYVSTLIKVYVHLCVVYSGCVTSSEFLKSILLQLK